jgi:outer membrane protein assembly factor BamB
VGWRHEDGGPRRTALVPGGLDVTPQDRLVTTTRVAPAFTMVVADGDRLYALRHTAGDGATAVVERIDPVSLEPRATSPELPGGPVWPGGLGVHDDGSVHVVFGNTASRLDPELRVVATATLPRRRPYNSFVPLPDGHLVTKDFGGALPGGQIRTDDPGCELLVLDPADLRVVARTTLPEPSIARLSAEGDDVYVVGDSRLFRVRWDGTRLVADEGFAVRYRTLQGQTYGWDCVLAAGAAWFLDDGEGTEGFAGTFRGVGVSTAPLHLVRVDLATGDVAMAEVCGKAGGIVANPPVVDARRGLAVGYDSGNGVVTGFDAETLEVRWRRDQDHASHVLLYEGSGELVTGDHTDVVVLDVATGEERARTPTDGGVQSVLFPAPGLGRDFYVCTFLALTRVEVVSP